jgi:tetratricopeptide (TPR) repeat protein
MTTGGSGSTPVAGGASDPPASDTITEAADTSGSYSELVSRANDLYDQGMNAFGNNDSAAGEQFFRDAVVVYEAAWAKQPGDPNVGTDYAVALFYRRHHEQGLQQINEVLRKSPDFQPAHLNKGIFLQTESSEAEERGDSAKAAQFLAEAKESFERTVAIDAKSESGQRAAQLLNSL